MPAEVEIKFFISDAAALERRLRENHFELVTPSTHEFNTLYDTPSGELRARAEVLRIRRYGDRWTITHKTKGSVGRHKTRTESETVIENGQQMDAILRGLGYVPSFVYEKFRAEWGDRQGHVVVDRTPIGDLAEIEGPPDWIDRIAGVLGVAEGQYVTKSYAQLFFEWRERTSSKAENMTFADCGTAPPSAQ